jgi:threonine synthase
MSFVQGLQCRECGQEYPKKPLYVCETCFGPLEIVYDYECIKRAISREKIAAREKNLWRYRELLPIDGEPSVGLYSGFTPLVRAHRLGAALGVKELYIKDDSSITRLSRTKTASFPSPSPKPSNSASIRFCASTGNLASSVAAHAQGRTQLLRLHPGRPRTGKIIGSAIYGPRRSPSRKLRRRQSSVQRNRRQVRWAFVNVNMRPYYAEGAKTHGFEVAEQLGWKLPKHIVVASAGGTILPKLAKGFKELAKVGLVEDTGCKIYSAQASGCAPIIKALKKGTDIISPVKPNTTRAPSPSAIRRTVTT